MTLDPAQLDTKVREAVRYFWSTREAQSRRQGAGGGTRDAELVLPLRAGRR